MGPNKGQFDHRNNIGPNKGQFDHRNNTLGPNKDFQPLPRSILKNGDKICPTFPAGTHTEYYRDNAPKPPPACGVSCLNRGPSVPNVLPGHRANSHMCKLSSGKCYISHSPGTPCCARQNEWQRTQSAPTGGSLSPARSPQPSPHTAVASHCSPALGYGEARRAVQGSQPPVTQRTVSGSKVVFNPVTEIIMPDGDSTYCNTTITYTTGHPERVSRISWRSGSPTELTN